jgi:hypothetical protein
MRPPPNENGGLLAAVTQRIATAITKNCTAARHLHALKIHLTGMEAQITR